MTFRVLVTGAAGFIGFHVAQRLAHAGHYVVGVDNFSPYYSVQLKHERVALLRAQGVAVHSMTLGEGDVRSFVEAERPTHIVHLAAQAGVRYSLQDPKAYLTANVDGFLSILEVARAFPSITTVYASSSSVYGTNTKLPFAETDPTDSPANLYGATKKANELMASSYHHLFGLKLIGLRFFTVYGPWGRPDMAYYLFAEKIRRGDPIEVFGHGALRRDFTYIDDIVDGIVAALSAPKQCAVYNLGNSHPDSVSTLISLLELTLGKKAFLVHKGQQLGDMVDTYADIRCAAADLSFSPKVSLPEGIARFAAWFLSYSSPLAG